MIFMTHARLVALFAAIGTCVSYSLCANTGHIDLLGTKVYEQTLKLIAQNKAIASDSPDIIIPASDNVGKSGKLLLILLDSLDLDKDLEAAIYEFTYLLFIDSLSLLAHYEPTKHRELMEFLHRTYHAHLKDQRTIFRPVLCRCLLKIMYINATPGISLADRFEETMNALHVCKRDLLMLAHQHELTDIMYDDEVTRAFDDIQTYLQLQRTTKVSPLKVALIIGGSAAGCIVGGLIVSRLITTYLRIDGAIAATQEAAKNIQHISDRGKEISDHVVEIAKKPQVFVQNITDGILEAVKKQLETFKELSPENRQLIIENFTAILKDPGGKLGAEFAKFQASSGLQRVLEQFEDPKKLGASLGGEIVDALVNMLGGKLLSGHIWGPIGGYFNTYAETWADELTKATNQVLQQVPTEEDVANAANLVKLKELVTEYQNSLSHYEHHASKRDKDAMEAKKLQALQEAIAAAAARIQVYEADFSLSKSQTIPKPATTSKWTFSQWFSGQ